jgi:pimeloyl-ACP methyl ester carboxylesterase
VVLLHGWPQHWYLWRDVIPELAKKHRVFAPDLRGFGWSDAPARGYEKEELATDVLALLDALDVDRVYLAGHDWGGWVGFLLALRAPDRVRRFLALNITHPWPDRAAALANTPRLWYQAAISAPRLGEWVLRRQPGVVRALLRRSTVRPGTWTNDELDAFVDRLRDPARAWASAQLYRSFLLYEVPQLALGRYDAQRLTVPTLLVFGTRDWAQRTQMLRGFERHADEMRLELVPDCGHFIVDERPDLVAARALELFQ